MTTFKIGQYVYYTWPSISTHWAGKTYLYKVYDIQPNHVFLWGAIEGPDAVVDRRHFDLITPLKNINNYV